MDCRPNRNPIARNLKKGARDATRPRNAKRLRFADIYAKSTESPYGIIPDSYQLVSILTIGAYQPSPVSPVGPVSRGVTCVVCLCQVFPP